MTPLLIEGEGSYEHVRNQAFSCKKRFISSSFRGTKSAEGIRTNTFFICSRGWIVPMTQVLN